MRSSSACAPASGPALIHADVTRPYSHSAADTQSKYRSAEELAEEGTRDPIDRMEAELVAGGVLTPERAAELRAEAKEIVAKASAEALAGPAPRPGAHHRARLRAARPWPAPPATYDGGDAVPIGEAIRRTLHELMAADERIRVFGEDVADAREAVLANVEGKGGVFGTTHGLQRAFGQGRCFNTPLSEANIIGRAVGQGLRGLRPAPEIQFFDYIWPAMTQIKSEAATIRWRSNGAFTCPMVVRVPIGGYLTGGAIWHSQCGESIFAHVPGLLIAFPSRARDAAGLLRYAFRCEDPVLFLEHKHLLRQPYTVDAFPPADYVIPFGVGDVRRPGDDFTIVTWGATVEKSLQAAARAAATTGFEVEVIDLRTISPWDHDLVAESVARTHRLLVVHEDVLTAGFGAEVAAWAAEHCFTELDAPVRRVAALDTHVAYEPTLEDGHPAPGRRHPRRHRRPLHLLTGPSARRAERWPCAAGRPCQSPAAGPPLRDPPCPHAVSSAQPARCGRVDAPEAAQAARRTARRTGRAGRRGAAEAVRTARDGGGAGRGGGRRREC